MAVNILMWWHIPNVGPVSSRRCFSGSLWSHWTDLRQWSNYAVEAMSHFGSCLCLIRLYYFRHVYVVVC